MRKGYTGFVTRLRGVGLSTEPRRGVRLSACSHHVGVLNLILGEWIVNSRRHLVGCQVTFLSYPWGGLVSRVALATILRLSRALLCWVRVTPR